MRRPATGVAMNVGQTLLEHAKKRQFRVPRQPLKISRCLERSLDSAARAETLEIPGYRRLQSHFFQHRRVEQIRKSTNLLDALFSQSDTLNYLLSHGGILRLQAGRERIQAYLHRRNTLTQRVVKIPSDPPSLFILQLQQVRGEVAARLLFLHPVSNIPSDLGETDQLAGLISNRSNDHVRPECRAVLANTPPFILETPLSNRIHQFPGGFACEDVLLRIKAGKMPADDLLGLISLDSFCSSIPGADVALGIEHEDRVVLDSLGH